MSHITPSTFLDGNILVTVPHMDDDCLACAGTLLQIPGKARIRLVYCTDGRGIFDSAPAARKRGHGEERIGEVRREETRRALTTLGIDPHRAQFLGFPEWRLREHADELTARLKASIDEFRPDWVLAPFRLDKHTDHIALNAVVRALRKQAQPAFALLEYFVYYRSRLLPKGDIRKYVNPARLHQVDIRGVAARKRAALNCHVSQTTIFFPWQHKPVLSAALLDEFCAGPEMFVRSDPNASDRDLLSISPTLVRLLDRLERLLKDSKERLMAVRHNRQRE